MASECCGGQGSLRSGRIDIFRGRIIDVTESTYVIELTGSGSKLDSFIQAIDAGLILETVRTGVSGIGRGDRILKA